MVPGVGGTVSSREPQAVLTPSPEEMDVIGDS